MEDNGGQTNDSTTGLTLGGILSIKETTPFRIQNRTLLDLIRDDPSCGNESKKSWRIFTDKLRLKLAGGSVYTSTAPTTIASHVQINYDSNRDMARDSTNRSNSNSPPVSNTGSVPVTQSEPPVEENRRDGGEPVKVKVSLMSLLQVDGSGFFDDDEAEEVVAVEEGGGGGGGGGGGYNNCCVCMVRHKGAAFIPCGHTFCRLCSRELFVKRANCPLCNNFISEILDIF